MPDEPQNQPQDQPIEPTPGVQDDISQTDTPQPSETDQPAAPADTTDSPSADSAPVAETPAIEAEPSTGGMDSQPEASSFGAPAASQPETTPVASLGSQGTSGGSKKKWILGGVIAAVLVVLIGGGALAYNLWYQNPEKVILDGIGHLFDKHDSMAGSATVTAENKQVRLDVTADMRSNKDLANGTAKVGIQMKGDNASFKKMNVSADYAADKDTFYFKLKDLHSLAQTFVNSYVDSLAQQYTKLGYTLTQKQIDDQKKQVMAQFEPIITKLDNRWIKIDIDSKKDSDDESKCTTDAIKKLYENKDERNEVLDVYKKHKFITIKDKLGSKGGSLGYLLDFDKNIAKDFSKEVKNTTFGKELQKCDPDSTSTTDTTNDEDTMKDTHVELWVSRWSHQITELKVAGTTTDSDKTAVSLDLKLDYDKVDGLTTPKDATDWDDINKELNGGSTTSTNPTSLIPISI